MIPRQTTAGTAGDSYRVTPPEHPWQPATPDPGQRTVYRCGREAREHTVRTPTREGETR